MNSKPDSVIFDLDGTLADLTHRLHHVKSHPKDWEAFFAEVGDDEPIQEIISLTHAIANNSIITHVIICSGRSEVCREETVRWLKEHDVYYDRLYMRPEGDYRPDHVLKQDMLEWVQESFQKPWLAVDDRDSIADVWRNNGIRTLVCSDWEQGIRRRAPLGTTLTIMVGPSGSGKTTWIQENMPDTYRVSSDDMRGYLTGDPADQSRNSEVFSACHSITRDLLSHGVDVVFDATNIRNRDRKSVAALAPSGCHVRYIVVDRPLEQKLKTADWRPEWLINKHHMTMQSNIQAILSGDGLDLVQVIDERE